MSRALLFTLLVLSLLCGGLFAQSTGVTGDNDINKCEQKTYTISILNNSGNPLTELEITNEIDALTGFNYVPGTTSIDVDGNPPITTANPTINPAPVELVWNIDTLTGSAFTLNADETLNITFDLYAGCTAVSGSQNVTFDYKISGSATSLGTNFSVQVLPGGVTIKKNPNVIPQELGQNVTWTITVENTGIGTIKNVVITDDLGAGLAYVSTSPAGNNAGQVTTWDAAQIPALALMNPGDIVSIDITSTVIACEFLDNVANAKWGCDAANTCFDTAVDGGTATASVQRIVKTPLIEYTPPNISFNYCQDFVDTSFTIQNNGDGTAHDVWINIDFDPMTVTNLPAGAIYNNTDKRFEITNPIPAGGSFDLSFRLNYSTWCGGSFPAGDLLWQTEYKDDCDQPFYPPVQLSNISAPAGTTGVSVTKDGSPEAVQIGSQVTYNITSSYTGDISCGSGSAGVFTVVDTVPAGFTVIDAGGGIYVPGGGGTGGTITWTYTPPASLNTSIIIEVPDRSQCESFCFTLFTNAVSVSGTDCCGCPLSENASQTTAIECEELVDSDKTVSPSIGIRCTNFEYTNTYDFAPAANVLLNDLGFEEHADNQQEYVPGSLSVIYDGADITGCVGLTDNTPGGFLILDFSGCAADLVNSKNLTITYQLTISEATAPACSETGFYSWSSLDMGTSGGECLQDGVIRETQYVTVDPPAMSVSITGLGNIVHKCEGQTITITLTQDSNIADPKDVRLVLSGLNYYVTDPVATVCGGSVAPISCTPSIVGDDYVWEFADGFTGAGSSATLQMTVQKRCTGSGDLVATAYFDDNCNDDGAYDDTCSTSATETPALLLGGDLLIEKTPEVYYASETMVAWKIYVTNRGSGNAYNVWVDDTLGAGLAFDSAVVSPNTGVTVTANQDHTGGAINGATIAIDLMAPGERREITFNANQIDCDNLTNDVRASWGCVGIDCQAVVSDDATVELPDPLLINTNNVTTPIDVCSTVDGTITLKNAGQTTCYNLQVTETLAPGLTYVGGSTRWRLNGGAWNGPNASFDPSPTTSPLQWTSAQIPGLATVTPGDIIEIDFDMDASCPFQNGNVKVSTSYENPCGKIFTNADSTFEVTLREPQINVTKTRVNEPVACGDLVTWTITVQNTSGYTLPIVWVEDTLGAAFTYDSAVGDAPFTSDDGTYDGTDKVAWELRNVNHNDTVTLTIRATTDSFPCSSNLDNTVKAWWGCGAADGSSGTKPGEDPPDDTLCLANSATTDTNTPTRRPSLSFLGITVSPIQINSCDDSTELTVKINNTGPTDARNLDLKITLPAGVTYNGGTSAIHIGPDDTGIPAGPAEPDEDIPSNTITYFDLTDSGNNIADTLEADGGDDTLVLKFSVQSNCFLTSDIDFELSYFDCCEDTQYSDTTSQTITALFPDINITKTPTASQVDCNSDQTWTITVTNNGTGNAEVVRIEDTLGDWIDYVSSAPAATPLGGQAYGWEIINLAGGGTSTSFTITGKLNPDAPQSDCAELLRRNNVQAIWGCGIAGDATDGDPNTTGYDCTHNTWSSATPALLQMPDLVISGITPNITCSADGTFGGTITVAVQNQGDGNSNNPFTVEVTDGKGWTGTGIYNNNIAPGATVNVTIDVATWNPDCQPCAATYSFNSTVDLNDDICECNEGNNDFGPVSYTVPIPELTITDIDFSNVSCSGDSISGTVDVVVRNNGCVTANNILVTLATDGCLAFSNETVVSLGAETSTTVSFTVSGSWADCTTQNCQFTAEVDPADTICECDGANNSRTETYSTTLPDLVVTDIDFSNVSCNADNVSGFVSVTVQNQGFGLAINFQVALATDGCLTFANQTVPVPLGAGASTTVNFPVSSSWTDCTDCDCQFTATVDATNAVCECDGSNNQATDTYSHTLPDLTVTSVTPVVNCVGDNNLQGTVTVNVANTGCGDANNAEVQLVSTCGVAFANQTVNLTAGSNTDLTFNFTHNCSNCTCIFIAIIDPGNTICECTGANNARASAPYTIDVPDLSALSDTLGVTCASDGSVTVSGNVTLQNTGCGPLLNGTVPLRFTLYDNTGCSGNVIDQWTYNATSATMFPGGGTQTFAIPARTIASNLATNSTGCQVSIRVEVDYTDSICECDGTNNTYCADNKAVDIPDIVVTNDTLQVTCANDGQATISGTLTVSNNGCGSNLATDFPVRFTIYDNTGCSGNNYGQWSQTLTGVNIPAGGGTQTFTITPRTIGFDMVSNSTNCQVSIRVEADFPDTICETDGTNNTYCADTKAIDIPDLETTGENLAITCESDGNIRAAGTVTITNNGCGSNMTSNIPVRFTLYDNSGCAGGQVAQWTESLAGANIAPGGGTQTFTITPEIIATHIANNSTGCNVSLRIETDYNSTICESDGTDNNLCTDKTVSVPELTVNSVTPAFNCIADNNLTGTVAVNVSNTGCGDANGVVVRLTSDCGITFTDQTVNLPAGGSANLTFNFTPVSSACTCTFTATIDPADAVCECNGANNSLAAAPFTIDVSDLLVQSDTLQATCSADNQVTIAGTVTVQNDGCGVNANVDIPVRFTLYDNTGCSGNQVAQWTQTFSGVNIASGGGTQTFTITPEVIATDLGANSTGCQVSIQVELDYTDTICEYDGTNNTYCADNKNVDIPDIEVTSDTLGVNCSIDGQVTVSGNVTLGNNGCGSNLSSDVPMRFTLYDNTGCSGNVLSQWTQTFSSVNIAPGGGTQAFAITPQTLVSDLVNNSTGCQVSIFVEADYTDSICESDGTDNTWCADPIPVDIPDLEPTTEALTITFNNDGSIQVSGDVTIVNNGCGSNMGTDIPMRFTIYDNINCSGGVISQWTETLTGANITPGGGTQTFTITPEIITTNICTNSTGCQVSILVEVDYSDTICESDGTDNSLCADKAVDLPELTVNSVTPAFTCIDDGNLTGTVTVNVENTGCGTATNAVVRLVSDCGITFADQNVTLPPSSNSDLIFNFTPLSSTCTCTFTATIDPDNTISECDGTNNTMAAAPFTFDVPDLLVQSDTLQATCSADNQVTVSGTVTVQNDGCGANDTADIPVRFTLYDNTGCSGNQVAQWTGTFTGVNIASGGGTQSFTITPEIIGTDLRANSTNCQFSIQVELDYSGTICEYDGTNNTYCADNKAVDIPDIVITNDTLGLTCASDGQATIAGTITITNNGCGSNLTTDFPVRFTLYDNTGCTGNNYSQWSQTLTGINIPAGGGTQTFTITPRTIGFDMVTNSTNCQVSIRVEADLTNSVCETDGTNNTWCADNKPIDIPDLETPSENLSISCTSDGNVQVSGSVTIANNGCGSNVTAAIPMRFTVYDNTGCTGTVLSQWTEDLGGANIAPGGGTQSFTITPHNMTLDFCTNSNNCDFSIQVEADYNTSICESDGTDNNLCSDKTLAIPNLTVTNVASSIVCLSDGSLTGTTVTVSNDGCDDVTGATVRLVSDCGLTFSDQTVDLAAGESKDLLFLFTAGITTCSCNFTATIDPDDTICECNDSDNTLAGTTTMLIPDIEVESEALAITCNEDGVFQVSGNVTLQNNGCGPDLTEIVPMRFTLYSSTGCSGDIITQWTENFSATAIASAGGTQTFTIQPHEFSSDLCKDSSDCQASIFVEADYTDSICEWDGTDNTLCGDKILEFPDLTVNSITPEVTCSADGVLQGTVTVNVGNIGCTDATRARVRLTSDCGLVFDNKTINIPQGARRNVVFNFTPDCESDSCTFTAIIDPGKDICECSRTNNQRTLETLLPRTNLVAAEITAECNPDSTVALTVRVENNGNQDVSAVSIKVYDTESNTVLNETRSIATGGSETISFDAGPYLAGGQLNFRLVVDEENAICECDGTDNQTEVSIYCPMAGTPGFTIERTCGPAQEPGGIYVFTIKVTNSGDADVTDCVVEEQIPDMLQYVHNSTTIDGQVIADPEGEHLKNWNIGTLKPGQTVTIQYQAIPSSDSDPGRYCNRAQVRGTALNGDAIQSGNSDCCVVLTRTNEGCCLRIIEDPRGFFHQPELPLSFVDPLFNTERGMMAAFSALDLFENSELPEGSHADSLKQRLKNYALSTIEEFYLTSRQGVVSNDNTLWLSYGAAYPSGNTNGWTGKRVDRTMTVAQTASELLALNRALKFEEDPVKKETYTTIINKKLAFLEKHADNLPHAWKLPIPNEESSDDTIEVLEAEASLKDKVTLYLAATDLKSETAGVILPAMEKQLQELGNATIKQDLLKEHLLYTLGLSNAGRAEQAKEMMAKIASLYQNGDIKFDSLYLNSLAVAADYKTGGSIYNDLFKELVKTYRVKESGVFAEIQPDLTYKIDLESLGALILAFQSQLPQEIDLFTTTMYRMVEESGLFITRKNLVVERTPLTLLKHYSFDEELLPMLSFTKGDRNLAPVFVEEAFVHSPSHLPATKNVIPDHASKVLIPEQNIDITEAGLLSAVMQKLGKKLQTQGQRISREKGRSLEHTGRNYFEYLLQSNSGITTGSTLAVPYQSVAIRGQKEQALHIEPIDTGKPFASETLANYLLAGRVYMEGPGAEKEKWLRAEKLQKQLLEAFVSTGYVPATFKLFYNRTDQSVRVEASEEKASKTTLAKLLVAVGSEDSFLENQMRQTDTALQPEDMLLVTHIPEMGEYFNAQLKALYNEPQPGINGIAAAVLAGDMLDLDTASLRQKLEKLWNSQMELPASIETETIESGLLHHYNSPQFLLYLSANAAQHSEFQFQRTLNMFTYLVEMGREGTPTSRFWLVEDSPRQHAEPGDVMTLKVRVTNDCDPNFMRPLTIPSLFIKAEFAPALVYNGTEYDEDLEVLGKFRWKYSNFDRSDYLTYIYQALIPKEYRDNYIEGVIVAAGHAGVLDMDPDKISGDRCIDKWEIERIPILPLKQLEIQVFADLNANGKKDPGETGVSGIQFRDTRGNIYRSNSEGQFVISTGDDTIGLQIQIQTIPSSYTLSTPVTRRINRHTPGPVTYGLVPCVEVTGIVYIDENQNGSLDQAEKKIEGIVVEAKLKEATTSAENPGQFRFESLPKAWVKEIRVAKDQPFNQTIPPSNLSIQIIKTEKKQ